jgi:2-oxoisovalerate dehydrogenase E1 component
MEGSKPQVEPAIRSPIPEARAVAARFHGLATENLIEAYRLMLLSRKIDDREIQLKRQNKVFFQINGVGHEAVLVAAAMHIRPGRDWCFAYYRDRALALALGMTAFEQFLSSVGASADPASGGRQMPSHWGHKNLNIVTQSSCVATQFLHAVGAGIASRLLTGIEPAPSTPRPARDEVIFVSGGDGSTSEGEFWESLNNACLHKVPVLFLIEDNHYAISVPVEKQTAGGSISRLVRGFPDLFVTEFDGCDFVESYTRLKDAFAYLRAGRGPALAHAHVIRPYSHSLSDDERLYKTAAERQEEASRDPIVRMRKLLLSEGLIEEPALLALEEAAHQEVIEAADQALSMRWPSKESWSLHMYSPSVDPTSKPFESSPKPSSAEPGTMVDLLNACLRDEMRRDPRIVVFGQDVADASREQYLSEVKGKGGVFKVTLGLQREFGSPRVWNSTLAEASIVGLAIGASVRGLKPVVEVQFLDYIWPAFMQIRNELATFRWRSNGAFSAPIVIRVPVGGYLRGGAIYHSQSGEVLFTHNPGLRVVMPSNALDANGLLRTAIRCDDPVLFLEHKHLYRQTYNKGVYPGPDYMIPFGKARRVREGKTLTLVTYGGLVNRSVVAAQRAEAEGVSVEILDLRSLAPYDWTAIAESAKKTNRVLVAYEDTRSFGYGAEIAARISEELFDHLDAPVRRIAAKDSWVAYNPDLEDAILPQTADLEAAILELARY